MYVVVRMQGHLKEPPTPHPRPHDVVPQATWSPGICPEYILLHWSTLTAQLPSTPRVIPLGVFLPPAEMDELSPNFWEKESGWLGMGQVSTCPLGSGLCACLAGVGGCLKSTEGSEGPFQCIRVAPDIGCGGSKDPKVCLGQFRAVPPFFR